MATVAGFNLTPVKSTALLQPSEIELSAVGAAGDRRFLFGRLDGTRPSGISKAPLLRIRSEWDRREERLTLKLPDGTVVAGDARPHGAPIAIALHDRSVLAREIDPAFAAATSTVDDTLTLLRVDEPEYAGGQHRVSLVGRSSVRAVGTDGGDPDLDPRRFRMLVEVDGLDEFEEDGWSGARVRLGDAVARIGPRIPRCVITMLHPEDAVPDFPTLDVLARSRKVGSELLLGLYGDVTVSGTVQRGDAVELLRP
jgi:MOSC domain-containing protein